MENKSVETAKRLRKALDDKCMKPIELARLSGINKGTISQYLSAKYSPTSLNAKRMGDVLKVSPMWLMGFDAIFVENQKYDKKEKASYYFTLLKEEDQDKVLEYMEFIFGRYEE